MNWYDNNTKPDKNKSILVMFNADVFMRNEIKKELTTFTGIYMQEDVLDRHYWIFSAEGHVKYIPVYDIKRWMYVEDFVQSTEWEMSKEPFSIICPHCKEQTAVCARAVDIDWVDMPVIKRKGSNSLYFDWDNVDMECDFQYVCENCEQVLARSMDTLHEIVNKHKVTKQ